MSENTKTNEIKVILVGDAGVGKTNLISVAVGGSFTENTKSSASSSYFIKKIEYKNKTYTLNIWDTIGQEKLRGLNKLFYKGAKIVIYVYDITREDALQNLKYWTDEIKDKLGQDGYISAVCGNKSDLYLEEKISQEDGEKAANSINAKFSLTSAKCNKEMFIAFLEELAHDYIDTIMLGGNKNEVYKLGMKNKKTKNKCC